MDPRFEEIFANAANRIFNVVFFPDRIYHAQYLNATRSPRYRYDVHEVRGKSDLQALKGAVYLDGSLLTNFLRIEYRGGRLVEQARERGRFVRRAVIAWMRLSPEGKPPAEELVRLEYCPWIDAFQVEMWETLEAPEGVRHDFKVAQMLGKDSSITRVAAFADALSEMEKLRRIEVAVREDNMQWPSGWAINDQDAGWDNFFDRIIQVPNTQEPSSTQNNINTKNYLIDFQRGYFIADASQVDPVRYRNAMIEDASHPAFAQDNVIEMRWLMQQEFGSEVVFFHEVTIPPGTTEGTHQHIGSEELYYIVSGEGIAYMGESDDPAFADAPLVEEAIFGLDPRQVRELRVKPGSTIFTKSGGIHGIRNPSPDTPLKFVAFLYHSS